MNIDHDVEKYEGVDDQHDDDRKVEPEEFVKVPIEEASPESMIIDIHVLFSLTRPTCDQTLVCKLHIQGQTFPRKRFRDLVLKEFHIRSAFASSIHPRMFEDCLLVKGPSAGSDSPDS